MQTSLTEEAMTPTALKMPADLSRESIVASDTDMRPEGNDYKVFFELLDVCVEGFLEGDSNAAPSDTLQEMATIAAHSTAALIQLEEWYQHFPARAADFAQPDEQACVEEMAATAMEKARREGRLPPAYPASNCKLQQEAIQLARKAEILALLKNFSDERESKQRLQAIGISGTNNCGGRPKSV